MTDRAELLTVSALALALPVAIVATAVATETRIFEFTIGRTLAALAADAVILAAASFILRRRGWSIRPFRVHVAPLTVVAAVLLAITYIWASGIVFSFTRTIALPEVGVMVVPAGPVWLTVVSLIAGAFLEEAFASAYLVEAFERMHVTHVVAWSAAVRAAFHLYQGPSSTICVFLLGLALAHIYRRERNIGIPFVAHTLINLTLFYFTTRG
jgi:membrane protease YdiL (CAAX protease family)